MTKPSDKTRWVLLISAGVTLLVAVGVFSGKLMPERRSAPTGDAAPVETVPAKADLSACLERGESCGGALSEVVAPARPAAPEGFRSLRTVGVWPAGAQHVRFAFETNPRQGVGDTSTVLAEIDVSGEVVTILPPVLRGSHASWRGETAWVVSTPRGEDWALHRFQGGAWEEVGSLAPQRTVEAVAPTPGGASIVYLRPDAAAFVARFVGDDPRPALIELLPSGLPWLRVHIAADGSISAFRSREAENKTGPPHLESAVLPAEAQTASVSHTEIPELGFDKVGFSVDHCFQGEALWALINGRFLMASADRGRRWSRAHTFGEEDALHGVSMACEGDRLVIAGIHPDSMPNATSCSRTEGCDLLTQLGSVHAQWLSARSDGNVLWHPAGLPRVGLSRVREGAPRVTAVFTAQGLEDSRRHLAALRVRGHWYPW